MVIENSIFPLDNDAVPNVPYVRVEKESIPILDLFFF